LEVERVSYHVFIDFDGTVTTDDVGYNFFKHFAHGQAEPIVQKYRRGEVNAVECLQTECDIYNEYPAPARDVREFIKNQPLCPGFSEFIEYCKAHGIATTILSAGFDFYIRPILDSLGLDDIELYATPTFIKQGRIYPEFVRYDKTVCEHCADCKAERIKELTRPGEKAVFIGDGHSDSHGAEQADIVFAKSFLADYLQNKRIDFIPYNDFHDIIAVFEGQLKFAD
jgi:2-hydroxy-3-keto-5-methylthiopentenyl-1-phosphate phosphatase